MQRTLAPTSPLPDAAFYAANFPHVRGTFDRAERQQFEAMQWLERSAAALIARGKVEEARFLISTFSDLRLRINFETAKSELRWLAARGGVLGDE